MLLKAYQLPLLPDRVNNIVFLKFVNMTKPPQPNSAAAVIFILLIILAVILSLLIVDHLRRVSFYRLVVYLDVKLFYPAC